MSTVDYHVVVKKNDGSLAGWGENGQYALGLGDTTDRLVETAISFTGADKVYCRYERTFVIKTDGTLWRCGDGNLYALGNGASTDITTLTQYGSDTDWVGVGVGYQHTVLLRKDGRIFGVGTYKVFDNTLEAFTDITPSGKAIKQVACGEHYILALTVDGEIWARGEGTTGRLGTGDTTDVRTGWAQVGTDTDWDKVFASGFLCSFAIKTDGSLYAWGLNVDGQLGVGDNSVKMSPTQVGTDTNWVEVTGGYRYNIALKSTGTLWGAGDNTYSIFMVPSGTTSDSNTFIQLGAGTTWAQVVGMQHEALALDTSDDVYGWGKHHPVIMEADEEVYDDTPDLLASTVSLLGMGISDAVSSLYVPTLTAVGGREYGVRTSKTRNTVTDIPIFRYNHTENITMTANFYGAVKEANTTGATLGPYASTTQTVTFSYGAGTETITKLLVYVDIEVTGYAHDSTLKMKITDPVTATETDLFYNDDLPLGRHKLMFPLGTTPTQSLDSLIGNTFNGDWDLYVYNGRTDGGTIIHEWWVAVLPSDASAFTGITINDLSSTILNGEDGDVDWSLAGAAVTVGDVGLLKLTFSSSAMDTTKWQGFYLRQHWGVTGTYKENDVAVADRDIYLLQRDTLEVLDTEKSKSDGFYWLSSEYNSDLVLVLGLSDPQANPTYNAAVLDQITPAA